ncbi:hypothetical protein BGW41_004946 [Actinomortierella wolfii]|nr:hypothetical protein BGW41_004946 [Actinomortierella wolfii]
MNRLPPEIVEVIVFHNGSFYNYAALGFCNLKYTDALMWMGGGPGVVFSDSLLYPMDEEGTKGDMAKAKSALGDNLRVFRFLRRRYSHFLTRDIALAKAVQTRQPRLVRRVDMVWSDGNSLGHSATRALMVAVASNFWWAVHYLLQSCNCCSRHQGSSSSSNTHPVEPDTLFHKQIRNIYYIVQGQFDQVEYTIHRPLALLNVLEHHPDPEFLARHLTDDTLLAIHRHQYSQKSLLSLAAYLGKLEFLRITGGLSFDYETTSRLIRRAVHGVHPKVAASLYVEGIDRLYTEVRAYLMNVYGGREQYAAEIEITYKGKADYRLYNHNSGTVAVGRVEVMLARENVDGLRACCSHLADFAYSPELVTQMALARHKVHLLSHLVAESDGADGIPNTVLKRYHARIAAALIESWPAATMTGTSNLLHMLNAELLKLRLEPLIPDSSLMSDVFLMVESDQKRLIMLQHKLVTTANAARLAVKGSNASETIAGYYIQWSRYVRFAPFLVISKSGLNNDAWALLDAYRNGSTYRSIGKDMDKVMNRNESDIGNEHHAESITLHHVARALRKTKSIQGLFDSIAIDTYEDDDDEEASGHVTGTKTRPINIQCGGNIGSPLLWKELIDGTLLDNNPGNLQGSSSLRKCDVTLASFNNRFNLRRGFTRQFWGPWHIASDRIPRPFDQFKDVLVMKAGRATKCYTHVGRFIAFLDPNISIHELLGHRWMRQILPWLRSLDANLYCQFLESYYSKETVDDAI